MILPNGNEVHDGAVLAVSVAVEMLKKNHPEHLIALMLAAYDPDFEMSDESRAAIGSVGLLTENGKMHDVTRDIIINIL